MLGVIVAATLPLASCSLLEPTTEASGSRIVVLLDTTVSNDGMRDTQLQHFTDVVLPRAEDEGAEVVLAAIDDDAREVPRVVARPSFDTASAEGNSRLEDEILTEARREAIDAATATLAGQPAEVSDVAGALTWAAGMLDGADGWRAIAVVSDAVSTATPCNMTLRPPSDAQVSIDACFPQGAPDLRRVEVSFLGAGGYREGTTTPVDAAALEAFWRAVVGHGGGTVTDYGPLVLGEPSPHIPYEPDEEVSSHA